jgi:hypothetical protein
MWRRPVKELEVAEHAVANIGAPMGLPATQRTSLGITPTQCLHFRKFHTSGIWIIPMLTAPIHVYDDSSWTLPSPRRTPRNIAQVDFTQYRLETPLLEVDIRFYTNWGTGVQRSSTIWLAQDQ